MCVFLMVCIAVGVRFIVKDDDGVVGVVYKQSVYASANKMAVYRAGNWNFSL